MYRVSKEVKFPVGHVLTKHKGKCNTVHGHQISVIFTLKSEFLNDNYMVIDFGDLKEIINKKFGRFDHSFIIDKNKSIEIDLPSEIFTNVIHIDGEPTAENLAKIMFDEVKYELELEYSGISLESVTIYENEKSSSTYSLD